MFLYLYNHQYICYKHITCATLPGGGVERDGGSWERSWSHKTDVLSPNPPVDEQCKRTSRVLALLGVGFQSPFLLSEIEFKHQPTITTYYNSLSLSLSLSQWLFAKDAALQPL